MYMCCPDHRHNICIQIDTFISRLQESALCNSTGTQNDADHMAERYNVVIKELLNELAPVSEFHVRERRRQP